MNNKPPVMEGFSGYSVSLFSFYSCLSIQSRLLLGYLRWASDSDVVTFLGSNRVGATCPLFCNVLDSRLYEISGCADGFLQTVRLSSDFANMIQYAFVEKKTIRYWLIASISSLYHCP